MCDQVAYDQSLLANKFLRSKANHICDIAQQMFIDWIITTFLMSTSWAVSFKDMFNTLSKGHSLKKEKKKAIKRFLQGIKKHLLWYTSPKDL